MAFVPCAFARSSFAGMHRSHLRVSIAAVVALAALPSAALSQRAARDTATPHYGHWRDELPQMLAVMSTVIDSGFDASTRAFILADIGAVRPLRVLDPIDYRTGI